jgi:hypothetical protein
MSFQWCEIAALALLPYERARVTVSSVPDPLDDRGQLRVIGLDDDCEAIR